MRVEGAIGQGTRRNVEQDELLRSVTIGAVDFTIRKGGDWRSGGKNGPGPIVCARVDALIRHAPCLAAAYVIFDASFFSCCTSCPSFAIIPMGWKSAVVKGNGDGATELGVRGYS